MLPNLVTIGAMKAGTTSLHHYLAQHPQITMSSDKELDFFVEERNWVKGQDWYEACFGNQDTLIRGETSPNYSKYPLFKGVPQRIKQLIPDVKLIYVVRDPIERIISHYVESAHKGELSGSLEKALEGEFGEHLLNCSRYAFQLEHYLALFPASRILLVCSEHLKKERATALHRVFEFLGVDSEFTHERFADNLYETTSKYRLTPLGRAVSRLPRGRRLAAQTRNVLPGLFMKHVARPNLDPQLRRRLEQVLRPDVEKLRSLTGQSFREWSV